MSDIFSLTLESGDIKFALYQISDDVVAKSAATLGIEPLKSVRHFVVLI